MTASLLLSWREGVALEAEGGGCRVRGPHSVVVLRHLAPALAAAVDQLAPHGMDEDRLAKQILEAAGPVTLAEWYYLHQKLARRGLLCRLVESEGERLATLLPISFWRRYRLVRTVPIFFRASLICGAKARRWSSNRRWPMPASFSMMAAPWPWSARWPNQ